MLAGRAKGLFISLGALVVLTAAGHLWWQHRLPGISEREYATQLLADYVRTAAKPKSVLVFGNPFAGMPNRPDEVYRFEKAGVAGLKRGFGAAIPVNVAAPAVKPSVLTDPGSVRIDPRSATPLSFLIESAAFDDLVKSHPDCDVAVSLIGLPVNLSAMESWNKPGAPRFALLLPDWRMIGGPDAIEKAFASGKLVAAVVARPNPADLSDPRQRYLLIDGQNFAQNLRNFPQAFGF